MLDMSWGEVMVIGAVALIVIGPKDLPKALRTVGRMTTKMRRMASEFQTQFNDAMREAELDEVRKDLQGLNNQVTSATSTAFNPIQTVRDELKGAIERKPGATAAVDIPPAPLGEPASAASLQAGATPVLPPEELPVLLPDALPPLPDPVPPPVIAPHPVGETAPPPPAQHAEPALDKSHGSHA